MQENKRSEPETRKKMEGSMVNQRFEERWQQKARQTRQEIEQLRQEAAAEKTDGSMETK